MKPRVTHLRDAKSGTLADRIAFNRWRLFVGRQSELAYFDAFIRPGNTKPVWSITGPGGIGKTMLAHMLVHRAADVGLRSAYLDALRVPPNPREARQALTYAMGTNALSDFGAGVDVALLVIDAFEAWEGLRPWLRDEYLPNAPDNLRIVLCGRVGPDLQWLTDQGWQAVMHLTRLEGLSESECRDYLERRGVAGDERKALIDFADGHPLALAMAADSALAGCSIRGIGPSGRDAVSLLVDNFTRDARRDAQHQALDACAIVPELNEHLLARMLAREEAGDLFDWLRGLSFIEAGDAGIYPHELVRKVLLTSMPERAPGRYEAYAGAAVEWIVDRIEAAAGLSWAQAARMAADGMYILRGLPLVENVFKATGTQGLYLDRVGDGDWDELHDMTLRHEGAESSRWFDFWRRRHPDAVYVIRDTRHVARAFFLKLDMEVLPPAERERDPLTRKLWRFLCDELALRPGDHVPFIRHWVTADYALTQSPEKTQILMAINAYNLMAKNLRATAQVFVDNPLWVTLAQGLGIRPVPDSDTRIGDDTWRIYYFDWQREPPPRYYRRFTERLIGFQRSRQEQAAPEPPVQFIDEPAFRQAVIDALRAFRQPDRLTGNPLLGSALVQSRIERGADQQDRVRVLREQLRAAADGLRHGDPQQQCWQRVLRRAYLDPAPNHKQAAAALNMSYSTFRRRLSGARTALADHMWRSEQRCRRP